MLSRDLQRLNLTNSLYSRVLYHCQLTGNIPMCVHNQTRSPASDLRGSLRTVRCYRGKKINIIEANYGRLTGGQICPGPIKTTYCGAARSQAKVRTVCQGKPQCVLQAKNSIYGDPCRGTKKYLEVGIIQFKLFLLDCIFLLLSISLHML